MRFSTLRSKFSFAISKSAVSRILMVAKSKVRKVSEFFNAVWVWVQGQRPTFISKQAFIRDFRISRIDSSRDLQMVNLSTSKLFSKFTVYNPDSDSYYSVCEAEGEWSCTCDDIVAHSKKIPCKHICKVRWGFNPQVDFIL